MKNQIIVALLGVVVLFAILSAGGASTQSSKMTPAQVDKYFAEHFELRGDTLFITEPILIVNERLGPVIYLISRDTGDYELSIGGDKR